MARGKTVPVNVERIKKMIGELGLTLADMDRLLGLRKGEMAQVSYRGVINTENLSKLALYLRVTEDVLVVQEEQKEEKKEAPAQVNTEQMEKWLEQLVIVMTDTNQKLGTLTELVRGNIAEKKELYEKTQNHFVGVNQWMNKIYNTMKYGGGKQ